MLTYQTTTVVEKPLKEVYDAITDFERITLWIGGLEQVEAISGRPGEPGFQSRYTFSEGGKKVIFEEEIIAVNPYRSFSQHLESKQVLMDSTFRFMEHPAGTKILVDNKVRGNTFFMKLMMPFLKGMMCKRQQQDFERFKMMVEGKATVNG